MKEIIFGNVVAKANNYQAVPSVNGQKRIIKTERLREYESSFIRQCKKYKGLRINKPFCLNIVVYFQSARNDIDNALKTILDCLQYVEAITDDNLCYKINAEKRTDKAAPRIEYEITPFAVDLGSIFRQ